MKAAPFGYLAPAGREEALWALRRYGADAKVLAGGQSLVPLLAMRLARPAVVVDLNRIADLAYVRPVDGGLAIGAMTRQRTVEHDPQVAAQAPLLREAVRWVGHPQIRNRGTVGGSLAHADPAAELPAVAVVLDAQLVLANARRTRTVAASDFFTGYLTTALEPDELLVEIRVPALPADAGWAFLEVARRHGDFALVGVAALLRRDAGGRISDARLAVVGVGHGPVRVPDAEQALVGRQASAAVASEVGRLVEGALDPPDDIHATARYRRHVAGVLAARAVVEAYGRMEAA
ncbi:MAG: xanthine dehydrogenase family protein subunit M [Armatimonadota bacterium]|nr:xanthine dehydrogenase family protein subunit M [Armatimonadota bacterium]MDR7544693.1 xanthine dehydrogenase family protein subunit M [Armatimonadota bacterium]